MQKDRLPEYPFLYSSAGFRYCDLLLSQEKYQEVQSRAEQSIEIARRNNWHLDIALDHLSLGRAHLLMALQKGSQDFTQAAEHLNQAVDGLRQAEVQEFIIRGLLSRAELYRAQGEFDKAQHDIEEAMAIAERGGMGLHQADCHLEYARLYLAMRETDRAREHLAIARKMIKQMGYHRRDQEVKELDVVDVDLDVRVEDVVNNEDAS